MDPVRSICHYTLRLESLTPLPRLGLTLLCPPSSVVQMVAFSSVFSFNVCNQHKVYCFYLHYPCKVTNLLFTLSPKMGLLQGKYSWVEQSHFFQKLLTIKEVATSPAWDVGTLPRGPSQETEAEEFWGQERGACRIWWRTFSGKSWMTYNVASSWQVPGVSFVRTVVMFVCPHIPALSPPSSQSVLPSLSSGHLASLLNPFSGLWFSSMLYLFIGSLLFLTFLHPFLASRHLVLLFAIFQCPPQTLSDHFVDVCEPCASSMCVVQRWSTAQCGAVTMLFPVYFSDVQMLCFSFQTMGSEIKKDNWFKNRIFL